MNLFAFGLGYSALHLARSHRDRFAGVAGTVTSRDKAERLAAEGIKACVFAPDGALVPASLRAVRKGGSVVCAGIHMSDIPAFPYELLWGERTVRSVANLTRADGEEFLALAPTVPVRTEVEVAELADANDVLDRLRAGRVTGAAVVVP